MNPSTRPRLASTAPVLAALTLGALMFGALLAGCDTASTGISVPVEASIEGDALRLQNNSDQVIPYVAVDPRSLILIDLDEETAPRLAARSSVRIPLTEIAGYSAKDTTALVVHWYTRARGWQNFEVAVRTPTV